MRNYCCHSERAIIRIFSVIQREPTATEESPRWLLRVTTTLSQTLLSFSRFARESPQWFHWGNDDVLHVPLIMGFHGLRPLNDGDLGSPRPRSRTRPATHSPLRTSFRGSEATEESPRWFRRGSDNVLPRPSAGDPRFARMTVKGCPSRVHGLVLCPTRGIPRGTGVPL